MTNKILYIYNIKYIVYLYFHICTFIMLIHDIMYICFCLASYNKQGQWMVYKSRISLDLDNSSTALTVATLELDMPEL